MKIAVSAISKNEKQFVERFCRSAKDADLILIADTGSTDGTVSTISGLAGVSRGQIVVREIFISPWRFDLARNAALALLPSDIDVVVSLDLDEELQPGWREEIERVWVKGKTTRMRYLFDWGLGIAFYYEKIHARVGYQWWHPVHEYPMPYMLNEEVWAQSDMLLVVHKPDPTKSRSQYLPLLKMSVEEDPHCPRNAFYYARELMFHGDHLEAIKEAQRYLALPRATWANERCYAYRVIGQSYVAMGDLHAAEKAYLMASFEAPNTREPWCALAELYYKMACWPECYAAAMRCLNITEREKVYTVDPAVWGAQPHLFACIGAWNIGLKHVALEQGKQALALDPTNDLLNKNLVVMYEIMNPPKLLEAAE